MFNIRQEKLLELTNMIIKCKNNNFTSEEVAEFKTFKKVGFTIEVINYIYNLLDAGCISFITTAIQWILIYKNINPLDFIDQNNSNINTLYLYKQYTFGIVEFKDNEAKALKWLTKQPNNRVYKNIIKINNLLLNPILLTLFNKRQLNLIQAIILEAEGIKTEITKK